jgi:transcriptional regulator with XRE-family HTH domain
MTITDLARLTRVRVAAANGRARALRQAAGLTQAEIAAAVGVAQPTVALWESGRRVPRGAAALRYAEALETLEAVDA